MTLYPIQLGVKRVNWKDARKGVPSVADRQQATEKVLQRDDHTCRCCGFKAPLWQQVLHLNGNDGDFSDKNVLTTCVFCYQCFDLQNAADMNSGMLIWLPELSQMDLNNMMRAVYVARGAQGPMNALATKIFDTFYARGEDAKRRLGSTDPGALAIVMRDFLTLGQYEKAQQHLDGIRLLPLANRTVAHEDGQGTYSQFPQILGHWRSKVFHETPAQNWAKMFEPASTLTAT